MIDVIDLKKNFGDNEVLKGINMTINKGDIVVVIGPSGSGKSTFLRCLNCMEDPTSGKIIFEGVDIADPKVDINIHRRKMGMVFQHFNLFNNKTVIENIMLSPVLCAKKDRRKAVMHNMFHKDKLPVRPVKEIKKDAKENAHKLLERIGLEDKADVYPSTLSGGQKQRVAIVRSLAMNPEVILFDEPTSALDPISTSKIEDLAIELKDKYTIVIVTHNMQQATRISDRTAFFLLGEMVEYEKTDTLFADPKDKRTEDYITGRFG